MVSFPSTHLHRFLPCPSIPPQSSPLLSWHPPIALVSFSSTIPARSKIAFYTISGQSQFAGSSRMMGSVSRSKVVCFRVQGRKEEVDLQVDQDQRETLSLVSRGTSKRFKWDTEMTRFLIDFLVHQASIDIKRDKSFRRSAIVAAANAVSQNFRRSCDSVKVERRLKTLKTKWARIEKLKGINGALWDPITKTINLAKDGYQEYLKAHPRDAWLLNRPIKNYDELAIIFCDQAAGKIPADGQSNVSTLSGIHMEEIKHNKQGLDVIHNEEVVGTSHNKVVDHCQQEPSFCAQNEIANSSSNLSSREKSTRSNHISSVDIQRLIVKMGELIDAIKNLRPRDFSEDLWGAISACGYNERMSITAFEYFLKNEVEGKIFLVRGPELRKECLAKFFSSFL